jgi:hypothetical protein
VSLDRVRRPRTGRTLRALAAGTVALGLWPAVASAHDGTGYGGGPVGLPVALWIPVVTGLLGGLLAVRYRRARATGPRLQRTAWPLGLSVLVLGVTVAVTALTGHPWSAVVGGCAGVLGAAWVATRGTGPPGHHADLTFGSVLLHRGLEGVALGVLYTTGVAVGSVGVMVIAGHTAFETAVVGGVYASRRLRALGAVALVQIGYVVGAAVGTGLGGSVSVPVPVHAGSLGLVGGVLLVVGATELRHAAFAPGHRRVPE